MSPYEAKKILAWLIVCQYWGRAAADSALDDWQFQATHRCPALIPGCPYPGPFSEEVPLPRLLVSLGLAPSTSQGRRLIEQGAVSIGPLGHSSLVTDPKSTVFVFEGLILRVGRKMVQIEELSLP